MTDKILSVEGLTIEFRIGGRFFPVVDGLSFDLARGEMLGIVGESGCGKSTTALAIMGLVEETSGRVPAGEIKLNGENLLQTSRRRMRQLRGNDVAMIFQEPMSSLNPVFTVGEQIAEVVRLHHGASRKAAMDHAYDMLCKVHIPAPEKRLHQYPHELSGGMRQRVMIAIALACGPSLLIADEPTTALDVTVQAQIFDLLQELRDATGTAIILITHDMGAVAETCQRVLVMYAGRKVEEGPVEAILTEPSHPYTSGLIRCTPHLDRDPPAQLPMLPEIPGIVPPVTELGKGCPFRPRCPHAHARCADMPPVIPVSANHGAACWLQEEERAA
ncbi:ABC transporter ATP-binding protein [Afifella sp. IM 167]|uniref:ABC transporter ATP-binding protein n=1 Tax=Afifella sp. IM 167 TaxID=2033586 RepID=UPI001CC9FD32|nr:ABC transporter ATP-binding protein [Afifella sp. IM 167]MBZ8134457.1 peptide ABC transporter ATP-binding protein [Afifella sp. IM 167]